MSGPLTNRGLLHFLRHEKWALATSVLLVAGVQFLEYHGWLAGPEGIVLDLFLRHAPAQQAYSAAANRCSGNR